MNINHVSFTVDSLDATIAMFSQCLGATLKSRAQAANPKGIPLLTGVTGAQVEFAFMQLGDITVEFVQYLAPSGRDPRVPRPCDRGFTHLAVNVPSVEAIADQAAKFGFMPLGGVIEILGGPDRGKQALYLRATDGLTIELIGN